MYVYWWPSLGTGSAGRQAALLPSNHEFNLGNRPVTGAGGLAPITPSNKSLNNNGHYTERQVQDASYFLGHLKTKENQIVTEIDKLKVDTERLERENQSLKESENGYDDLLTEVHELEGELADYNLAMDKKRSGVDPEDVETFQKQLNLENVKLANDIDEIFITRQKKKKEISDVEEKINKIHLTIHKRIQTSDDQEKIQKYDQLMRSLQSLHLEGKEIEKEIDELRRKTTDMKSSMTGNSEQELKSQYKELQRKESEVKDKIVALKEDLKLEQMDPDDAHAYLLEKVKLNKSKMKDVDKKKANTEESIKRLKKKKDELVENKSKMNSDHNNKTTMVNNMIKEEEEMKESLKCVKNETNYLLDEKKGLQSNIVTLMQEMSENTILLNMTMPSTDQMKDMEEEVNFRQKHLEAGQQTIHMLEKQKLKRENEVSQVHFIIFTLLKITIMT